MKKASMIDCDATVKALSENEMGILLLEADKRSPLDILAERTTWEDRQGIFGNGCNVTCHLFPLMYTNESIQLTQNLITARASAIHNIFERWDALGYNKKHSKSPFKSKAFSAYLDEIEFMKADYMWLEVE